MTRRMEIAGIVLLALTALAVRVYYLEAYPNALSPEYEAYSKINLMLQWEQSPLPYPDTNFGPLHAVLLWAPWALTGDLVGPSRGLTLALGLLALVAAYRLVRRNLGPAPALGSLALLALAYPLTVGSTVTLAEMPFVCFTLWAIDLLDGARREAPGRWLKIVGAAAAASAASATRFEGWPLLAVYAIYLFARRQRAEAVVFTMLAGIFPAVHMYVCWEVTGNPLSFLQVSAQVTTVHSSEVPLWRRVLLLPWALTQTLGWPGLLLGATGVGVMWAKRRLILPTAALLVLLAIMEQKSIAATLDPRLLRYTMLPVALLALYAAWPAWWLAEREGRRAGAAIWAALAIGVVAAGFSQVNAVREERAVAGFAQVFEMTARLRQSLAPGDRLLIGNEFHPILVVESGLPWRDVARPVYDEQGHFDAASLAALFAERPPTHILYDADEPAFGHTLGLAGEQVTVEGLIYRRAWTMGRWTLYARAKESE